MRILRALLLVAAAAGAVAAAGGCLEADAGDGVLLCSSVPGRECPEGYYCERLSMSCYKNGDYIDMAGSYPDGSDLSYQQFGPFTQDLSGAVQDLAQPPTD